MHVRSALVEAPASVLKGACIVTQFATPLFAFIFDTTVATMTISMGYRLARDMRGFNQFSIAELILRDGQYITFPLASGSGTDH